MSYHELLLEELKKLNFESLLEVGCGFALPNLKALRGLNPNLILSGFDKELTEKSYEEAEKLNIDLNRFDLNEKMEFWDKCYDVVLSAAVLCTMRDIDNAVKEIKRIVKKYIVLVEFQGEEKDFSTGDMQCVRIMRNYPQIFGLNFKMLDIPKSIWPGNGWNGEAPGKIMIAKL